MVWCAKQHHALNVSLQGSAREMGVFLHPGGLNRTETRTVGFADSPDSPGAGVDVVKRMEFPF